MAKKVELKTKVNDTSVEGFLNSVTDEQKRKDCFEILRLMKQVTKEPPKMWGTHLERACRSSRGSTGPRLTSGRAVRVRSATRVRGSRDSV